MELARLILEYIQALVWPLVAIIAISIFRNPLMGILNRLKSADLPYGVSLDFEKEIRDAKELSREVQNAIPPKERISKPSIPLTEANARMLSLGLQPSPSGLDMNHYRDIAEKDPNIALAGLRMEIETMSRNLAKGFKVNATKKDSASSLLRKLYEASAITLDQYHLAHKMVSLCNAAIHGKIVSLEEAVSVIDAAKVLADQYVSWLSWGFPDDWKPLKNQ